MNKKGTHITFPAARLLMLFAVMLYSFAMITAPACAMDMPTKEIQGGCHGSDSTPKETPAQKNCCNTMCCHLMDPLEISFKITHIPTYIQLSLSHQSFERIRLDSGIERPPRSA